MIPRTKDRLLVPIPNGKGKVTQEFFWAARPPFFISGEN
jgi:hypothetical protein